MASFKEVDSSAYTNVATITGANIRNLVRNGTSVTFEYQAYIYQSGYYYTLNSLVLWVEGSKEIAFWSNSGKTHTTQNEKYYSSWHTKTITLGINESSASIKVGVNGKWHNPDTPDGYITLTLSGIPTVSAPSLNNISIGNIKDKGANISFTIASNNNQVPYSPHIYVSLNNAMSNIIASSNSRSFNVSGLDANRTYYVRGDDANDAGRTYTNIASFTTTFTNPTSPGNPTISYSGSEPSANANLNATWTLAGAGSNPVSGYTVDIYKNNTKIKTVDIATNTGSYDFGTFSSLGCNIGDSVNISIQAYSLDWNNVKHYSSNAIYSSNSITVVSDKFIYVSQDGGNFTKYKMFISINGGEFKEIKKENLKIIK